MAKESLTNAGVLQQHKQHEIRCVGCLEDGWRTWYCMDLETRPSCPHNASHPLFQMGGFMIPYTESVAKLVDDDSKRTPRRDTPTRKGAKAPTVRVPQKRTPRAA